MTLISKYTNEILREFVQYNFDNRDTGDLANIIANILSEFQEESKQRDKTGFTLNRLRNLHE